MKDWIKEKLKIIDTLYPKERLEKSKERWRRLWEGEAPLDRYPFVYMPVSFNYYNAVYSKEEGIRRYLDEFIYRGFVDDDFIPAFFPGCRQGTIPGMFGAREIILGQDYSCERIIHDLEDVDKLPEPSIRPGTPAWDWLEMQRYYLDECEAQIPIHVCDMQGPMDVCGQLWGYDNLLLSVFDDEEYYHKIMELATQAYIMLWEAQKELLGDSFIGTHLYGWDWIPSKGGATLSADSMVMVSADFFNSYYVAYLEKIAQRFGRLSIHSCGNFKQVVPALAALDCVSAVNASQMSVSELLAAGWNPQKVIINIEDAESAEEVFSLAREQGLRLDVTFGGLWPGDDKGTTIPPEEWSAEHKKAIKEKSERILKAACKSQAASDRNNA